MGLHFSNLILVLATAVILLIVSSNMLASFCRKKEIDLFGWGELGRQTGLKIPNENLFDATLASGTYCGHNVAFSIMPIGGFEFNYVGVCTIASVKLNKRINNSFSINRDTLLPKNRKCLNHNDPVDGYSTQRERDIYILIHKQLNKTDSKNRLEQIKFERLFVDEDEISIQLKGVTRNTEVLCAVLDILVEIANLTELNS